MQVAGLRRCFLFILSIGAVGGEADCPGSIPQEKHDRGDGETGRDDRQDGNAPADMNDKALANGRKISCPSPSLRLASPKPDRAAAQTNGLQLCAPRTSAVRPEPMPRTSPHRISSCQSAVILVTSSTPPPTMQSAVGTILRRP